MRKPNWATATIVNIVLFFLTNVVVYWQAATSIWEGLMASLAYLALTAMVTASLGLAGKLIKSWRDRLSVWSKGLGISIPVAAVIWLPGSFLAAKIAEQLLRS